MNDIKNYINNCFVIRKFLDEVGRTDPQFQVWEAKADDADRIRYGERVNRLVLRDTETTRTWEVTEDYRKKNLIQCYAPKKGEIFVDCNENQYEVHSVDNYCSMVTYDYLDISAREAARPASRAMSLVQFWRTLRPKANKINNEVVAVKPESNRKPCFLVYCQDKPYEQLARWSQTPSSFTSFDKAKTHADDLVAVGLFPAILWGEYDPELYYELPTSGLLLLRQ